MKVERLNRQYAKPDHYEILTHDDEVSIEIREEKDGKKILYGYAAIFDQETEIAGLYREVIRRGAFKKTLRESDQVALWNHDSGKPLGRKSNGTLTLKEDEKGLRFQLILGDTTYENDAYLAVKSGNVSGMSIGFRAVKSQWHFIGNEEEGTLDLRELREVQLFEISPVTFPAYKSTEVDARSVMSRERSNREAEQQAETTHEPERGNHSREREPDRPTHSPAGTDRLRMLQLKQRQMEMELKHGCAKTTFQGIS